MTATRRSLLRGLPSLIGGIALYPVAAHAASRKQIDHDASGALQTLFATQPKSRELSKRAKAVLIFPKIIKAGLVIGGLGGDGVLRVAGRSAGYYNIAAASFGLQAGVEAFSYALFFMTDSALKYLSESDGWSIGSGPSVVVVDKGAAASLTSTTLSQDVYAFPFGQRGLMAGLSLEVEDHAYPTRSLTLPQQGTQMRGDLYPGVALVAASGDALQRRWTSSPGIPASGMRRQPHAAESLKTTEQAAAMIRFDPDLNWTRVDVTDN